VAMRAVLAVLQKEGLIPKRSKQRLDSTQVLRAVSDLNEAIRWGEIIVAGQHGTSIRNDRAIIVHDLTGHLISRARFDPKR
jgi:hypothetical protein